MQDTPIASTVYDLKTKTLETRPRLGGHGDLRVYYLKASRCGGIDTELDVIVPKDIAMAICDNPHVRLRVTVEVLPPDSGT